MLSRSESGMRVAALTVALIVAAPLHAQNPQSTARVEVERASPTAAQIAQALNKVKADPNLATETKVRTLQWVDKEDKRTKPPGWFDWVADLFKWFAESARVLLWVLAGVLAALIVVYIVRLIRARGLGGATDRFVAPTHVRDLDIRPESLPADIGAAARALWDKGEHRAALALLYRGLLSRLAHVYRVPIRDSTTEGDCLALAALHLSIERNEYVVRLVRVWQRAVYGGQEVETTAVHELCEGFAAALDPAPAADLRAGAVAAGQSA